MKILTTIVVFTRLWRGFNAEKRSGFNAEERQIFVNQMFIEKVSINIPQMYGALTNFTQILQQPGAKIEIC